MASAAVEALKALEDLQAEQVLSIVRLSDSIAFPDGANELGTTRSSDVSADNNGITDITPASVRADLAHYKELFSKLRFSYIEQVTKEKFLRAITAAQPVLVEPAENAALEAKLVEEKTALAMQKEEVARMVGAIEARGRALVRRHERVQAHKAELAALPARIEALERGIEELRAAHPSPAKDSNPDMNLSLPDTQALLAEREERLAALDAQIAVLQAAMPKKEREIERLEAEMGPLQNQKKVAVAQAIEARKLREEGGVDEMEERGRWFKASEAALRSMLDVEE